jgi:uncharacterized protein YutE (UPF0331/DUF86 family)
MAPEVLSRKLSYLRQLLADLAPYEDATLAQVEADHYKLERLFELLVMAAGDIVFHMLAERKIAAESYGDAFRRAAAHGLLPAELGERLQDAAAMRNLLVHLYEDIDYRILRDSIEPALNDFGQFVVILSSSLDK